jgi:hypothetical protein
MKKTFINDVTRQGRCYLASFILGDTVNYMLLQDVSHDSQHGRASLGMPSMENKMSNFTRSIELL